MSPVTHYEQTFFSYFEHFKRLVSASPMLLGGATGSGGGIGGPPGGFIGMLPQTRVAMDLTEGEVWDIPVSGTLVTNLDRIRYRLANVEAATQGLRVYEDGALVASGVTIIDFITDAVSETTPGRVAISGHQLGFTDLSDTPKTYTGQANGYLAVKGDETGVEFIVLAPSGGTSKVKVSSNDTTENFLESKLSAGTNIQITVLNEGGNEQLLLTSISGVTDHGLLDGLLDDDHTLYLNEGRHDTTDRHTLGSVVPLPTVEELADTTILDPQPGDSLVYDGSLWINSTIGSTSQQKTMTFGMQGELSIKTLEARILVPFDGTISNVVSTVNTPPQGQSIILDIYKNGVTVYGTTPANRPTILAGNNDDLLSIPDTLSFLTNDVFTVGVIQAGTTTSGSDLVLQIRCMA